MKKLISIFLAVMILCVTLVGCAPNTTESTVVENAPSMFVVVEQTGTWRIVYHKDTKVMYAVSFGSYNCGTFTPLVNQLGMPMLWMEENS